MLIFNNISNL